MLCLHQFKTIQKQTLLSFVIKYFGVKEAHKGKVALYFVSTFKLNYFLQLFFLYCFPPRG